MSAAKPPVQPPSPFSTTTNTGFGSPNISGFSGGNNNNITNSPSAGFQSGFGNPINTPPTSSSAAPPNTGFGGGFANPSNAFSGIGSSNLSPNPSPSLGAFGAASLPTSTTTNPSFQSGFASSNNSITTSPFSGFQMTGMIVFFYSNL